MSGARFTRRTRLRKPAAFRRVFDEAWRSSDSCFTLLARPNGLDYSRLGLAISKRSLPTATERNRVKRIARESFRAYQNEISGFDLVVVSRSLAGCDNARLRQSLEQHFNRLKVHAQHSDHSTSGV